MPDWEGLVVERLADTRLAPEVQRQVVAEITAHLQELYAELVRAGCPNPEAQTLAQVSDWRALCRNIRRSKEDRMSVARRVFMPGVAAVIAAIGALKLLVHLLIAPEPCGPDMTCISVSADGPVYLPWLVTLPLAGALAASLARRMGGAPGQRVIAALFPAFYLAAETVVASLLSEFFWRIPIYWVLIPAIACAVGALPFLGAGRDPDATPAIATSHP